jgi:hypothetical protein
LDYIHFRRRGVPLGSGAIESAIRRVINLRLKGNSISWYEENARRLVRITGDRLRIRAKIIWSIS